MPARRPSGAGSEDRWTALKDRIARRLARDTLLQNTARMMVGQGARAAVQAVYFLLIARSLGAESYGAFVAVAAAVAIAAPFASCGTGNLLIRDVAREPQLFRSWWGKALTVTLLSGGVLIAVVVGAAEVLLPRSIATALVLCLAVSDLIFARLLDLAGQAYQAFERLQRTAQLQFAISPLRCLAAAGLALTIRHPTAEQWGVLYLATGAVTGIGAVWLVNRELGAPRFGDRRLHAELGHGLLFSVSLSAQGIYNDLDKTLLARLSRLDAAGIYGVAYRIVDLSFVPIRSLMYAAYAEFFRRGQGGVDGSLRLARRLVAYSACYGLATGVVLFAAAPNLSWFLGPGYAAATGALQWLAPLPLLRAIHSFGADALTGAGYQTRRTALQVFVVGLNVLLCLWLIPPYSWRGAAWASLASDGALAVTTWVLLLWLRRRERLSPSLVVLGDTG